MPDDVTRPASRPDSRSKIVEVAARLLQEQGPSAVTTRGVAQAAGVQAPMLYRLFGDKNGLLEAVAEHVMSTYVLAKEAVVEAASANNVDPLVELQAGWTAQIEFAVANPTLFALLSDPARAVSSPAAQAGAQVLRTRVHRVALTGRLRVSEQRAVNLIRAAGSGAVLTLLSTSKDERDPGLVDSIYEAVLREILTNSADPNDSSTAAAAVTLRAHLCELDMLSAPEQQLLSEWLDRAVRELS